MDFDAKRIDDVIHGRFRLGIIAYLSRVEAADFNELKLLLEATAGNLSVHLRKLEEAGYIRLDRSFISRKSLTRAHLTKAGRAAFVAYLKEVNNLLQSQSAKEVSAKASRTRTSARVRRSG